MTDRRTLTRYPSGRLFSESAYAALMRDWDARAAASRPVVRRLSITELPASRPAQEVTTSHPGAAGASVAPSLGRTEVSADVGPSGAPDASIPDGANATRRVPRRAVADRIPSAAPTLQLPAKARSQPGLPPHSGTPSPSLAAGSPSAARGG